MYRALYRKWRPATFSDVIGQENIVTALQSQINAGKVGHAYIFTGTRGTGKTTCAKIFAKAVNCENKNGANPCGECNICNGIDSGAVLDVTEIDAASNNGVDNIRDLRDETVYTPGMCAYKVYIIDEVHMLSGAAFNALLKIMEEPPSHVIFILATTEIHKVPATILSRCQRYDFSRISAKNIADRLLYVAEQEGINIQSEAADLIARLADGAMRDALSILDTCISANEVIDTDTVRRMAGVTDKSYLFELSDLIKNGDAVQALALIANLREKSIDMKRLCDELIMHYRNFMLVNVSAGEDVLSGVNSEDIAKYKQKCADISAAKAVLCIKILCRALEKTARSSDVRIELELAVFEMCDSIANGATNNNVAQNSNAQTVNNAPVQAAEFTPAPTPLKPPTPPAITAPLTTTAPVKASELSEPIKQEKASTLATNEADNSVTMPAVVSSMPSASVTVEAAASTAPLVLFEHWQSVINAMESKDSLLFVNMRDSKAYFDGKRVLIDGGDFFLEYMRQNKSSNALIRQVIKDVTGHGYAIGPYKNSTGTTKNTHTAMQAAKDVESKGVAVVYDDEN